MQNELLEKVLIDQNTKQADIQISEMKNVAMRATALIKDYNSLSVLSNIETAEQAKNFLNAPEAFLNSAVLRDTGFKSKIQPSPAGIAVLYGIDYERMLDRITNARISGIRLELFSFDESTRTIQLMPESEELIRETAKIYLTDGDEINEYKKVKQLCNDLNDYFARYRIHPSSMNAIPTHTGLRCQVKADGQGWELVPDIASIRKLRV